MKVLSTPIFDKKINSNNVLIELTIKEYAELIKGSVAKNDLQRDRVRSAKTIYALLKQDIITGCIFPPIVLAMDTEFREEYNNLEILAQELKLQKENLYILDGLQRTYTILDIYDDAKSGKIPSETLNSLLRLEVYIGVGKEGVLYRMLTLNTGQTPMSLRHQVEIIYSGLLSDSVKDYNFQLLKDTDPVGKLKVGMYKFSDAVDCFTSYMEGDYLQITREKLLSTIKLFDKLKFLGTKQDLFISLISYYTAFVSKIESYLGEADLLKECEYAFSGNAFGTNVVSIFNKSQPLTGFGAALSRLVELNGIDVMTLPNEKFDMIDISDIRSGLILLLKELDFIKRESKKIGNSQRCFFYHFFKVLFDKEGESYLEFEKSVSRARQAYDRDK